MVNTNIFLTVSEYKSDASALAEQYGGAVMVFGTYLVPENSQNTSTTGSFDIPTLRVTDFYPSPTISETDYINFQSHTYGQLENTLSKLGFIHLDKWAGNSTTYDSFAIPVNNTSNVLLSDRYEILYYAANVLNKNPNFDIWLTKKDGTINFIKKQ